MRRDALDKSGGDVIQVREYIAGGQGIHHGGRELFFGEILVDPSASLEPFDLVHLTNLDRPFETYHFYAKAKALGKKIVFSTIHHSYREIAAYERQGRGGLARLVTARLNFRQFETIRTLARLRHDSDLTATLRIVLTPGIASAQREMVLGADRVLLLNEKERRDILEDCTGTEAGRFQLLLNGLPAFNALPAPVPRDIDICVVGRIEARKNQIEILEAVESCGLSATFVGAPNPNHAAYCDAFKQRIEGSRSTWLGAIPREDTLRIMQRSRVHVSASWFEVLSLVDLEAYACGCWVVASLCGGTQDVLGSEAMYVTPDSRSQIVAAVQQQLGQSRLPREPPAIKLPTWADIAVELAGIYRELV